MNRVLHLALPFTYKQEQLVGDAKVGSKLGCSSHEVTEFKLLRDGIKVVKQDHNPGFQEGRL